MAYKIFIDTNILLDILDTKRPFSEESQQMWQQVELDEFDAFISESVLTTTDYILQKTIGRSKRLSILSDLLDYLQVLPCNTAICQKAIKADFPDLEDAILYQIAVENDLDYFISNDYKLLKKRTVTRVPVISATALLKISG